MPDVNWLAVLLCGLSSMVLGAIWYSPSAPFKLPRASAISAASTCDAASVGSSRRKMAPIASFALRGSALHATSKA